MCEEKFLYASVILPIKFSEKIFYAVPSELKIVVGKRVTVPFGKKFYTGVVSSIVEKPQLPPQEGVEYKEIMGVCDLPDITPCELLFWEEVANYYLCTVGEVFKAAYPSLALEQETVRSKATPEARYKKILEAPAEEKIVLTPAQTQALEAIENQIVTKPVLLYGASGSGKTEIYICLADKYLQQGKSVLYLVPEIALSRQLEERLRKHFGARLSTFHSEKTVAQKKEVKDLLRFKTPEGKAIPIVILGTRSSIFLPFQNLGLVIVDEEQEGSYKQEEPSPRYNAKNAAMFLCKIHKADILLGSATPSLDTIYNCKSGRYALVELSEKYYSAPPGEIRIIDTLRAKGSGQMNGELSQALINEIKTTLDEKKQVLIFRNAKGAAGTGKIEEELKVLFPKARTEKYDGDICKSKTRALRILREFEEGNIDILIGTQILSKGFDFAGLKLTAVLQIDVILSQPDFRADEKAYWLLNQLLGRVGRRRERGKFLIQTSKKKHPVFLSLEKFNNEEFWNALLRERRQYAFPPFVRMITLTIRHKNPDTLNVMADKLGSAISLALLPKTFELSPPYTPKNEVLRGFYQRSLDLKLARNKTLKANKLALKNTIAAFKGQVIIDVDPQ